MDVSPRRRERSFPAPLGRLVPYLPRFLDVDLAILEVAPFSDVHAAAPVEPVITVHRVRTALRKRVSA